MRVGLHQRPRHGIREVAGDGELLLLLHDLLRRAVAPDSRVVGGPRPPRLQISDVLIAVADHLHVDRVELVPGVGN